MVQMRYILNTLGIALLASGSFMLGFQAFSSFSNYAAIAIALLAIMAGTLITLIAAYQSKY